MRSRLRGVTTPLWTAVYALREAEALAGLGNVAGPTDAPPAKPEEENSWTLDWLSRAKDALKRAQAMHDEAQRKGMQALQERAARIVTRLRTGARAVLDGARNVTAATREELGKFHATVQAASNAWSSMQGVFALALIIGAVWYFTQKR